MHLSWGFQQNVPCHYPTAWPLEDMGKCRGGCLQVLVEALWVSE